MNLAIPKHHVAEANRRRAERMGVAAETEFEPFPDVSLEDEMRHVMGHRVVVQMQQVNDRIAGSSLLKANETAENEAWSNCVAKVLQVGPGAFRSRETGEPWSGYGDAFEAGDIVLVGRHSGSRFKLRANPDVEFRILADDEILAVLHRAEGVVPNGTI